MPLLRTVGRLASSNPAPRASVFVRLRLPPPHHLQPYISVRLASSSSSTPLPTDPQGIRSTLPSSSHPYPDGDAPSSEAKGQETDAKHGGQRSQHVKGDRGYLSFTKTQLFKLTLPLAPPASNPPSPSAKHASASGSAHSKEVKKIEADEVSSDQTWEEMSDAGHVVSQTGSESRSTSNTNASTSTSVPPSKSKAKALSKSRSTHDKTGIPTSGSPEDVSASEAQESESQAPAHSVIFLIHSAQPIWYISELIRAEGPSAHVGPATDQMHTSQHHSHSPGMPRQMRDKRDEETPPITFHTRPGPAPRWSPATGLGDFLREASRLGSFVIRIGPREIHVSVPSFESRSLYLRSRLYSLMDQIQEMSQLKAECDRIAKQGTKRLAYTGAAGLASWWVAVAYISFGTEGGWDVMEPVVTVTGLGAAMAGYVWFLLHDREVTYRTVLRETTSRRQQALYSQKGLDLEVYEDLIEQAKELRARIKGIANDYDLEWDQGNTASAKHNKKALDVVRAREAQEEKGGQRARKDEDEKGSDPDEDGEEEEEEEEDEDEEGGRDEEVKKGGGGKEEGQGGEKVQRPHEGREGVREGREREGREGGKNSNKALREKKSGED